MQYLNIMSKYYAVVNGKTPGIYTSWPETQSMISGFSGAIYKGFKTREDAVNYINKSTFIASNNKPLTSPQENKTVIYTDGGFKDGKCGFGIVIITSDGDKFISYGRVPESVYCNKPTNNVAELYAIYVSLSLVDGDAILYTDSTYSIGCLTTSIHNWLKNGWNNAPNRLIIEGTYNKMINRNITFLHASGHKGIQYNEECDKLATEGRTQTEPLIVIKNGVKIEL